MRRLMPLIATLLLIGLIAWFAMRSMGSAPNSVWYVVAARDIPAYTPIERDQITLREITGATKPPPTAIAETSGPTGHAALDIVIGKASGTPIRANSVIRADTIRPFDELQNDHGAMVLIARTTIMPHHPLLASQFHPTFKETQNIRPGIIIGRVGQHAEQILEQYPSAWSNKIIREGQMLQIGDLDLNGGQKTETANYIDLNAPVPVMDRTEFIDRLNKTPGAIPLGISKSTEVSRIAGYAGPIDLYVGPPSNGTDTGIIVYRKVLRGQSFGMTASLTQQVKDVAATQQAELQAQQDAIPAAQDNNNNSNGGNNNGNNTGRAAPYVPVEAIMKTVNDARPIFWIRTAAPIANQANALRVSGAQFIAVPAGKSLNEYAQGISMLCDPDGSVCYQNLPASKTSSNAGTVNSATASNANTATAQGNGPRGRPNGRPNTSSQ